MGQQTGPGPEPGHKWKAALHTDKLYVWAEHTGGRKRPVKWGVWGEPELQGRRCRIESTAPSSEQGKDGITVLFYRTSLRAMGEEIPKVLPQFQQPTINSFGI